MERLPLILLIMCWIPWRRAAAQDLPPARILEKTFIYDTAPFPSCHASTLAETPEGIAAAWFGGTHEKHPDVEIWFSRRSQGGWTAPVSVANGIQPDGKRHPCWNPVLYQIPGGRLMLFYKVGPTPQEWWGELITSGDGGRTWSPPRRLPEGILGPVKNKPELLPDGRLVCPSSTETKKEDLWRVHLEVTRDFGETWERTETLNDGKRFRLIQPSVLVHGNGRLQLMCRSREGYVVSLWSEDDGRSWSVPDTSSRLPNPNSGTDAVSLAPDLHLIVYNRAGLVNGRWGGPRTPLMVALSRDGVRWKDVAVLEDSKGEFSYPAVIKGSNGEVHLTYTWNREKIRYVRLKTE